MLLCSWDQGIVFIEEVEVMINRTKVINFWILALGHLNIFLTLNLFNQPKIVHFWSLALDLLNIFKQEIFSNNLMINRPKIVHFCILDEVGWTFF